MNEAASENENEIEIASGSCRARLRRALQTNPVAVVGFVSMTVVATLALAAAGYFAGLANGHRSDALARAWDGFPATIDASTATSNEKFSIATGLVSPQAEGVFVLDHSTGVLQCSVYYPRVQQFMANYTVNVSEITGGLAKGGGFLMVTGEADMTIGGRGNQWAPTLVYVLNTGTGNYAVFGVPFDQQALAQGRPQVANLVQMAPVRAASAIPAR